MKVVFVCFFLIAFSTATPVDNLKLVTTLKPTSERIKAHGYPAEEHVVKTEDGYLVQMFRIPYSHKLQNQTAIRPAVFIQHGLFSCSDAWIATGPDSALPYLLADSGYDVWMGNARGNAYSRKHVKYSVDNPKFWRFSWHEIAVYDISAMIDYILAQTGEKSVHYVGHSQGTTVFFVLMSMLPAYNDKTKTAHMLAPVAYMSRCIDPMVTVFYPYLGHHGIYSALFGSAEFLPRNELFTLLLYNTCGEDVPYTQPCSQLAVFYGKGDVNTNKTALRIIMETHPAGASTDQVLHYMQGASSGDFKQFDFGTKINKKVYNNAKPPGYEVERISSEVHFYYSESDTFAAVEDVLQLADRLPNLKSLNLMADPNWSHTDFSMANEVKSVINDKIMGVIKEYESDLKKYIYI